MNRFWYLLVFSLFACETKYPIPDEGKKILSLIQINNNESAVIVVLQNENCICTEENMNFAFRLLTSRKYDGFKKTVILSSTNHPFQKKIVNMSAVEILINSDNLLLKNGLIIMTDRLFIYDSKKPYYVTEELKEETKLLKEKYLTN